MANVKYNGQTFYVPSDKFLIGIKGNTQALKEATPDSAVVASLSKGQVFAVISELNGCYHLKPGWINQDFCERLAAASNEITPVSESFVVKIISNIPVLTEASIEAHATTVLRPGDLCRVVGESEDFFQLETGDFIEKRGCRRY